jgi:ribosomal-protein-alanine N-acetyltransferase
MIHEAGADQAESLAALHAAAFDHPWTVAALRDLLSAPGVTAFAHADGFILIRVVVDEAEILTLAVSPAVRRQGLGRRLVEAGAEQAAGLGAVSLFLEVAADNAGALALYRAAGFAPAGRRSGYYPRAGAQAVDALVLKRPLDPPA